MISLGGFREPTGRTAIPCSLNVRASRSPPISISRVMGRVNFCTTEAPDNGRTSLSFPNSSFGARVNLSQPILCGHLMNRSGEWLVVRGEEANSKNQEPNRKKRTWDLVLGIWFFPPTTHLNRLFYAAKDGFQVSALGHVDQVRMVGGGSGDLEYLN